MWERFTNSNWLQFFRELHERYEAQLSATAVLLGFTVDYFTLTRVDLLMENVVIITYLLVAASAIYVMHLFNQGQLEHSWFRHADWWVPLVMQFAFGGLFSVFLIFYGRSGALLANLPFFLILIALLVGNEFFRTRYQKLTFNTAVFYTALLAYLIFAVPVVMSEMGPAVFVMSGIASLLLFTGYVSVLPFEEDRRFEQNRLLARGLSVFLVIALLYVLNLIPPIPLSLKETRIAYDIDRVPGQWYRLQVEADGPPWYERLVVGKQSVPLAAGQPLYFYSAVFAPTDFDSRIVHHWQYWDSNRWRSASRIGFTITGGREQGYRGYSYKRNLFPGSWRVSVETEAGQVIGRDTFEINVVGSLPPTEAITY